MRNLLQKLYLTVFWPLLVVSVLGVPTGFIIGAHDHSIKAKLDAEWGPPEPVAPSAAFDWKKEAAPSPAFDPSVPFEKVDNKKSGPSFWMYGDEPWLPLWFSGIPVFWLLALVGFRRWVRWLAKPSATPSPAA